MATLAADREGEVNEARLVPALLRRADGTLPGSRLGVLDRPFGDLVQPERLQALGDPFVIRYHRKVHCTPKPATPAPTATDAQGRAELAEWGWLGAASNPRRRYVRRLTVQRSPGPEAILVVTDLLDGQAYPAAAGLALYRQRWSIEQVFQQITEVFALRSLIGGTPEATVFPAAFCLVLYNLIQVVRHYAAVAQACAAAELSAELIYRDVQDQLTGLFVVVPTVAVTACLDVAWTADELRAQLTQLLGRAGSPRWRKAINRQPRTPRHQVRGKHQTSVHRLQAAHCQKQPHKDRKT